MSWTLAQRAHKMNPSVLRELLKVTEQPGIINLAGGLPSPQTFPIEAIAQATQKVLTEDGQGALQYAASEGYGPLREWVAADLRQQGLTVQAAQVLITTGSQQGLDLVAKVLIDAGVKVLVERPTYLGALQAFAPMEPQIVSVASDEEGVVAQDLRTQAPGARFAYLLPNFQNPTGRSMSEARRAEVIQVAQDPYGDLWFDQAPPAPLSARHPEGCIYLGSFSKILAPGLRLGYLVAPAPLYPKLLQAKQAADLHSPSFNQRIVFEVIHNGMLTSHVPRIRALYKAQRDAMLAALTREMTGLDVHWSCPQGGMFVWLQLPPALDAAALLPQAVKAGMAFVPGSAFYADRPQHNTLRLSFVTADRPAIDQAIQILAQLLKAQA